MSDSAKTQERADYEQVKAAWEANPKQANWRGQPISANFVEHMRRQAILSEQKPA
jgi:hypothetical protein